MIIEFRDGLLFTLIQISFRGNMKVIDNIVIDTGAAESIISPRYNSSPQFIGIRHQSYSRFH